MADNGTVIGLVALATAVFTGLGLLLKHIKHSECMRGCCEIDTRSPTRTDSIVPQIHHRNRKYGVSEDENDENNIEKEIKKTTIEIDV